MEARYLNASKRMKQFNKRNAKMLKIAKHGKDIDDYDQHIIELFNKNKTQKEIANILEFSLTTLQRKMKRMGLKKIYWTSEEIELLKRMYQNYRKEDIIKVLNKRWIQITKKAHRLKLLRNIKFKYEGMIDNTIKNNPMKNLQTRKKVSETLKAMYKKHPFKRLNCRLKRNVPTLIEIKFERMLCSLGYKPGEDFLYNTYLKTHVSYKFPDFMFPKQKILFEVDGKYWHKDKTIDRLRDMELEEAGYQVYHFTDDEIMNEEGLLNIKCIVQKLLNQ